MTISSLHGFDGYKVATVAAALTVRRLRIAAFSFPASVLGDLGKKYAKMNASKFVSKRRYADARLP